MAPQSGPGNLRALSKVSEEASSLEKQSSGDTSSGTAAKGPGLVTDRDGRQSTSMVLGNIHEQVGECSHCFTLSTAIIDLHTSDAPTQPHASRPQIPGSSLMGPLEKQHSPAAGRVWAILSEGRVSASPACPVHI